MLQTIEVTIDAKGQIHPLEALPVPHASRALLTIFPLTVDNVDSKDIESAFGFLKADKAVSLDEMKLAVRKRGAKR